MTPRAKPGTRLCVWAGPHSTWCGRSNVYGHGVIEWFAHAMHGIATCAGCLAAIEMDRKAEPEKYADPRRWVKGAPSP